MRHFTNSRYKMPRLIGCFTWMDLTDIGKQYFPEFEEVMPMGRYIKMLSNYYKVTEGVVPDNLKNLRKIALGNSHFSAPNEHRLIGIEDRLNNASIVWIFFHEIGHLLNNHFLTRGKGGSVSVRQVRAHEKIANKFAYEEILRRGLVPEKNLEKFELFYQFIKARDKLVRYEGFDGDAVFTAELEVGIRERLGEEKAR